MPSTTFFNLPQAKREKLLNAAREEFARVSYDKASVNRIIRAAHIPRGSFYMYFTDKEELFSYLMEEYGEELAQRIEELLKAQQGDLPAAFVGLFDYIQEHAGAYHGLLCILRLNTQMRPGLFLAPDGPEGMVQRLRAYIDLSKLDLRKEEDLDAILHLFFLITGGALMSAEEDGGTARARMVHLMELILRGALSKSAAANR